MTKPIIRPVWPAKTQISLCIHPVWQTCLSSLDSLETVEGTCNQRQPVQPPSMARVLVYPSLDSLETVEGTCDQQRL